MAYQGNAFPINTYETDVGLVSQIGCTRDFRDEDRSKQFLLRTSEWNVKAVLVQNTGGAALSPGQALRWVATKFGAQVQKAANGSPIVGFVPAQIQTAATIPDQAFFWMIIHGPTSVLTDATAVVEGDQLEASATAGSVKTEATAPAANKLCRAATAWAANGSAAVLIRAMVDCRLGP